MQKELRKREAEEK
jgi:hypothetical protein